MLEEGEEVFAALRENHCHGLCYKKPLCCREPPAPSLNPGAFISHQEAIDCPLRRSWHCEHYLRCGCVWE